MRSTRPHPRGLRSYLYPSLIVLICLFFGMVMGMFAGCSRADLEFPDKDATIVFDIKTREVGRFFVENRETIPLGQMPQTIKDAIIAVEDARFYSHRGIDLRAIARAIWADIRGGRYAEGGSTITQQLARNAFLSQKKLMSRKISEAFYALKIERQYSKDQILEAYLNQIYFGHRAYGIERAAGTYFGKRARALDLTEAALLAGIVRSPGLYDPYLEPKSARDRRALVLQQMVRYGYISQGQANAAAARPLGVVPLRPPRRRAAFFLEYIQRQLADRFRPDELDRAGLRIYTTLNNDVQDAAEAMIAQLPASKKDELGVIQPQIAVVALDPATGQIEALVGGRDYGNTQYNRADRAPRQPGSAFKPFAYTAAIDSRAFNPASMLVDEPVSFPTGRGSTWTPSNYDRKFRGQINLLQALEQSVNVIAVKLVDQLGPSRVASYARKMGLHNLILSGRENDLNLAALALGGLTRGVTPLELAAAYAPLANGGVRVEPLGILKVTDRNGNVLLERGPRRQVVLSAATAYVMTTMLRRVVANGTGRNAYLDEYHPVAGKTGTTSDNTNAWFIGYTPGLLAAVWIGNDVQKQSLPFGSAMAARLWNVFMRRAAATLPAGSFVPPPGVTAEIAICKTGGGLFTGQCPVEDLDYAVLLEGTTLSPCPVHGAVTQPGQDTTEPGAGTTGTAGANGQTTGNEMVSVRICAESGALANAFCPEEAVETRSYRRGEEPTQYCATHGP